MTKPKAEKPYLFVRVKDGRIEHTTYTRYSDGSAGFAADGFVHCYELRPDAWRTALVDLQAMGFVELREAESAGLVPTGWCPEQCIKLRKVQTLSGIGKESSFGSE